MRLRSKFIGIYTLIFTSVVSVVVLSLGTLSRLEKISASVKLGDTLLSQSRRVRTITKDVMIGAFAPDTYANLKDVLYFDPYTKALNSWIEEADRFKNLFAQFMNDPTLLDLVHRGVLKNEHDTARIMSQKAFNKLDSLQGRLWAIRDAGLLGEDLYIRIQSSSDSQLIALFDEARQTSYYLANNFESYLNYFIESLSREAAQVRRDLLRSLIILGIGTALLATLITLLFSSRIVRRLKKLSLALQRVSAGDFSTPLRFESRDEFEDLAESFNRYTGALKTNLASMVTLAKTVADTALNSERRGPNGAPTASVAMIDRVLQSIVQGAQQEVDADAAALVVRENGQIRLRYATADFDARENSPALFAALEAQDKSGTICVINDGRTGNRDLMAGLLGGARRKFGLLAIVHTRGLFNDLDLIRFENYLEFAALVADNATTYGELVEQQKAEYLALQSQVQPHFLYNVLSSFAALNRMGQRETLEKSIISLKELLRYTVDHREDSTLKDELEFARRYCELQKMRFQDRLNWDIQADPELWTWRVPKLILQPLVENAIIHGIEGLGEPGTLRLFAKREERSGKGFLILTISDDGIGFDSAKTPKGVGITNVERRLGLAYGGGEKSGDAHCLFSSEVGRGTTVTLSIPERE
jgi:sensor histidine kinase YesM